ncbi:MAG: energy-coupling factor transporter transmembrane component T family protein, partial [Halobacteriota archaeon]
ASEPQMRGLASEMKFVFVVVAAGVVARVATEPTASGAFDGFVAGARFVFIVALAYAVASTSTAVEFEASVESALRRVPFVRESDWAVMFGAAARFLPTVRKEVRDVRRAHRSRLGDRRRFDRRLRSLAFPVLVGSLRRADTLALAMASRAYSPGRTRWKTLSWRRLDYVAVGAAVCVGFVLAYV